METRANIRSSDVKANRKDIQYEGKLNVIEDKETHIHHEKTIEKLDTNYVEAIMTGAISGVITTAAVSKSMETTKSPTIPKEDKDDRTRQLKYKPETESTIEEPDDEETNEINILGSLSEKFESVGRGPGVINGELNSATNRYEVNYKKDRGGLSYGSWQIETAGDGTMNKYLEFLERNGYDDIHNRLQQAGGFEGAKNGDIKFVNTWQQIAKENPILFRKSQYEFIKKNNYEERALYYLNVNNPNFDLDARHPIIKDVLWSTGVQHSDNGVKAIMGEIFRGKKDLTDEEFIHIIYNKRAKYIEDNGVENNVNGPLHKRYINEMNEALERLKQ